MLGKKNSLLGFLLLLLKVIFGNDALPANKTFKPEAKSIGLNGFRQAGFPKFPFNFAMPSGGASSASCGKRHVFDSPPKSLYNGHKPLLKVVGGAAVPYGAYPWTVHIESLTYDGFEHACGGTIVSEYFVITAAHCLHGLGYREVRVKVGDNDSSKLDISEKIFEVESWKVHPEFQKGGFYTNDIAVLKVKPHSGRGILFDHFVAPACLPSKDTVYSAGTWCYVSGWGLTHPDEFLPSTVLRAATVPILPKSVCSREDVLGTKEFQKGMLCAGYLEGKIDACNGDSGGPLVCDIDGHHTLLGVVSWGDECAKKNKPGIYSDVKYYLDFITKTMHEL